MACVFLFFLSVSVAVSVRCGGRQGKVNKGETKMKNEEQD